MSASRTEMQSHLWRRLDQPGHDCCRLRRSSTRALLSGAAVFWDGTQPCHFVYEVQANGKWESKSARVAGFLGNRAVDLHIRSPRKGRWLVNEVEKAGMEDCLDLDLGFTPATNLIALRRLRLRVGSTAAAPAAYLQFPDLRLVRLPQRYTRLSRLSYDYQAPSVGYAGRLEVDRQGAIIHYPRLFARVPESAISNLS